MKTYIPHPHSRTEKKCETCGTRFMGVEGSKYCSRGCLNKASYHRRKPRVVHYCQGCGVSVGYHASTKWCKSCRNKLKLEHDLKREREARKVPVVCQKCDNVFIGNKKTKYCPECRKGVLPSLLDAIRSYAQRQRAIRMGLPADFTQKDWRAVKRQFNNRCAYCGRVAALAQDHFVPVARGGGYTRRNIVPACSSCNNKKGGKDPQDWLPAEKYRQIAAYLAGR